jgi:hypothetical protein
MSRIDESIGGTFEQRRMCRRFTTMHHHMQLDRLSMNPGDGESGSPMWDR